MKISIVIPCYASEQFLEKTIDDIIKEVDKLEDYEYEIILVNDCSPDGTFQIIEKIAKKHNNILGINLAKNFGQHAALMAGFQYVTGDLVVCMDDDGQTVASELYKLLGGITDQCDVVYAKYPQKKHAWYRNLGSRLNGKMTEWLLGKPKDLDVSSYFVAKRYVIEEVKRYTHSYPYIMGLVLRTTKNIKNVEVAHKERTIGESGYSMKKLIALWMNGFTAFSIKPLRIADFIGAICASCGFLYMVYVLLRRIICGDRGFAGWSSLISINLFIGGIVMCILGMIGEYIGRMYICMNNAPQFVVKETTHDNKQNET